MNNYHTEQTSRTIGTVLIAGLLAGTSLPADCNKEASSSTDIFSGGINYIISFRGTSSTYELNNNLVALNTSPVGSNDFEVVLSNFFDELSSNQVSLGHEFERILFDNIWDLYQS